MYSFLACYLPYLTACMQRQKCSHRPGALSDTSDHSCKFIISSGFILICSWRFSVILTSPDAECGVSRSEGKKCQKQLSIGITASCRYQCPQAGGAVVSENNQPIPRRETDPLLQDSRRIRCMYGKLHGEETLIAVSCMFKSARIPSSHDSTVALTWPHPNPEFLTQCSFSFGSTSHTLPVSLSHTHTRAHAAVPIAGKHIQLRWKQLMSDSEFKFSVAGFWTCHTSMRAQIFGTDEGLFMVLESLCAKSLKSASHRGSAYTLQCFCKV